MRMHHRLALRIAVFGITDAKDVHFDPRRHQRYDRMHALRDARCRVQRDRGPHGVDILLQDTAASQELSSCDRAFNFEALADDCCA
jgi:hypothetical protein